MRSRITLSKARIDPRGRLVEQQQRRIGHQRARKFEEFALAAGKHARRARAHAARALRKQEVHRPVPACALLARTRRGANQFGQMRSPLCPCAPSITFSMTRHAGNGRGIWKVRPRPCASRASAGAAFDARPRPAQMPPEVGSLLAGYHVEKVVLPGPVRPDEPEDRPRGHVDRDVVDRRDAPETLDQATSPTTTAAPRLPVFL